MMSLRSRSSAVPIALLVLLLTVQLHKATCGSQGASATFEDDDDDEAAEPEPVRYAPPRQERRAAPPPDSNDDEFVFDEEEFEGVESLKGAPPPPPSSKKAEEKHKSGPKPGAPSKPRRRKELSDFYPEVGALAFLVLYGLHYLYGKRTNRRLAESWVSACEEALRDNFALVGNDDSAKLMHESANQFLLYCSGRVNCESALITLDLKPRQDLFAALWDLMAGVAGTVDTVTVEVLMGSTPETGGGMDKYCMAVMPKHEEVALKSTSKDLQGTALRKWKTNLHDSLMCVSEDEEVARELLPEVLVPTLNDHRSYLRLIHFSDRMQTGAARRERAGLKFVYQLFPVDRHPAKDGGKDKTDEEKLRVGEILLRIGLRYIDKVSTYSVSSGAKERIRKVLQMQAETEFKKTRSQREAELREKKNETKKAALENMSPAARAKYEEKMLKKQRKEALPVKAMKMK